MSRTPLVRHVRVQQSARQLEYVSREHVGCLAGNSWGSDRKVKIEDFDHTDCMFFFGQNVGVNSPRMLHQLDEVRQRGVPIITFNPLRERGLEPFTNPQNPLQMLTLSETKISTQYHQLNPGGDLAAIIGLCKTLIAADEKAKAAHQRERVLDVKA